MQLLPESFVKLHLPNIKGNAKAVVSVSPDYCCNMKIRRLGRNLFFTNEVRPMFEKLNVGFQDFLVFDYFGGNNFTVTLFKPDCSKFTIPLTLTVTNPPQQHNVNETDIRLTITKSRNYVGYLLIKNLLNFY